MTDLWDVECGGKARKVRLCVEPNVSLVASTTTDPNAILMWLASLGQKWPALFGEDSPPGYGVTPECVVEAAGRQCYNSFAKGRPTLGWFENVIGEGHTSVLRHASFTFAVAGVSRSLLQQIARHHHMDPSVLSQRFVDQGDDGIDLGFVVPPAMLPAYRDWELARKNVVVPGNGVIAAHNFANWIHDAARSVDEYRHLRQYLIFAGASRKEAGEAARSVLPECMETRFFISANGEGWLHYLKKRLPEGVDAEHRRLARVFAEKLKQAAPHIFASIEV